MTITESSSEKSDKMVKGSKIPNDGLNKVRFVFSTHFHSFITNQSNMETRTNHLQLPIWLQSVLEAEQNGSIDGPSVMILLSTCVIQANENVHFLFTETNMLPPHDRLWPNFSLVENHLLRLAVGCFENETYFFSQRRLRTEFKLFSNLDTKMGKEAFRHRLQHLMDLQWLVMVPQYRLTCTHYVVSYPQDIPPRKLKKIAGHLTNLKGVYGVEIKDGPTENIKEVHFFAQEGVEDKVEKYLDSVIRWIEIRRYESSILDTENSRKTDSVYLLNLALVHSYLFNLPFLNNWQLPVSLTEGCHQILEYLQGSWPHAKSVDSIVEELSKSADTITEKLAELELFGFIFKTTITDILERLKRQSKIQPTPAVYPEWLVDHVPFQEFLQLKQGAIRSVTIDKPNLFFYYINPFHILNSLNCNNLVVSKDA